MDRIVWCCSEPAEHKVFSTFSFYYCHVCKGEAKEQEPYDDFAADFARMINEGNAGTDLAGWNTTTMDLWTSGGTLTID